MGPFVLVSVVTKPNNNYKVYGNVLFTALTSLVKTTTESSKDPSASCAKRMKTNQQSLMPNTKYVNPVIPVLNKSIEI